MPAFKDTIVVGTTDSVATTLDPSNAYDYFGDNMINNLGAPLVDLQPGNSTHFIPALATDWSVSADGLTWTFNLRQGVKFGDGSCCFNASIVKYSFDREIGINDPTGPIVGVGYGAIINRTEAASTYQVVFHLNEPFAPFLALMPFAGSYMVTPAYAPWHEGCGVSCEVNYTAGNARASYPTDFGPYVLSSWTRVGGKDTEMTLDANPYYWNASGGYPRTPHIIIKFYSDATSLALAASNGEVDIAYRQLRSSDIISLESNPAVTVWKGTGQFIQYLVFNEAIKPFNDPRVRRAIAASINRTAITETVFRGQAVPLYSLVPIGMFSHQDVFKIYGEANYTYTQSVLQQLGYSSSNKLVVDLWYESSGHYPQSADLAAVLKSSLEASGVIQVNLHNTDWSTFIGSNVPAGNMPAYILGWYADYIDPNDYTYNFFQSSGSSWLHDGYSNPQADAVIDQALASRNETQRAILYGQAQQILAQDAPIVPLYQSSGFAVSKPSVGGVVLDFTLIFRYYLLYETTS
jgi:peptide/nickel transport system substrate-binding protein